MFLWCPKLLSYPAVGDSFLVKHKILSIDDFNIYVALSKMLPIYFRPTHEFFMILLRKLMFVELGWQSVWEIHKSP
jgi:hypothetical protein